MLPDSSSPPVNPSSFLSTQVTAARSYYFDMNPRGASEMRVVCGGCERMDADYVMDRSDFPFLGIEFVAEGSGSLELAGSEYRLSPGVVFAYGPGIPHRIMSDPAAPMLKYYVDFVGKKAEQFLVHGALSLGRVVQLSSLKEVTEIFECMQRQGTSQMRLSSQVCTALLPVLFMMIDQHAVPYGAGEMRALETYQRVKQLIETQFLTLRSAEEIADATHIDRSYLSRLFQKFDDTTPYRFLTKLKMNHAVTLLLDERMMVKEAAEQLGFADSFHFSRTFKRIYGISPEHFLRQSRMG